MWLQQTVERTGRKVERFLLRLFRFKFRKKGSCCLTCVIVRNGNGCDFRLCFGAFCRFLFRHISGGSGFHRRPVHPLCLLMLCRQPAKFLAPLRREVHHHFIETVDGRIGFPIQSGINIFRVALLSCIFLLCLLAFGCRLDGFNRRDNRKRLLRFGWYTLCLAFLFGRLLLFYRFFYGHTPKVKQSELNGI